MNDAQETSAKKPAVLEPNSTTRTPATDTPPTEKNLPHPLAHLALRCGKFVVELLRARPLVVSVAGVRVVEIGS